MELFELALKTTPEEFQHEALKWLEERIGFDGIVWGGGEKQQGGALAIDQFLLSGRPAGLVADYPAVAVADPVSLRFMAKPTELQNVDARKEYRLAAHARIGEYLDHYRVRHLQIMGAVAPGTGRYSWIVCYREEENRGFACASEPMARNAICMVLMAEQIHRAAHAQVILERQIAIQPRISVEQATLSPRQLQILYYIGQGWSNKLIAHHLSISGNTLKSHIKLLFRALGVTSRYQALVAGRSMKVDKTAPDPQT